MSDTRAAMREFRFLDDKRRQGGLSSAEEERWGELRHALGIAEAPAEALAEQQYADPNAYAQDQAQAQAQGYYAEDGNWYPYDPAAYAQQGYYAEDGNWYPYTQEQAQGQYDVNQLTEWAIQQGYTPEQAAAWAQEQVQAQAQGYADPNQQAYADPNAAAQQGYDPNAYAAAYAQQGYDPSAYAAYAQQGYATDANGSLPDAAQVEALAPPQEPVNDLMLGEGFDQQPAPVAPEPASEPLLDAPVEPAQDLFGAPAEPPVLEAPPEPEMPVLEAAPEPVIETSPADEAT